MTDAYAPDPAPTAVLVLASGEAFHGIGVGAVGEAVGEVCFNTAMTGYQEILTDPSYAAQIVTFTFPHVGNTGTTSEDEEATTDAARTAARGAVFRASVTPSSNWRSQSELGDWLESRNIIGLSGVDTRALTAHIRDHGMPNGVIAHDPAGKFDIEALAQQARDWSGLVGADLAKDMAEAESFDWREARWSWPKADAGTGAPQDAKRVVLIDYGVKRNILRNLVSSGLAVTVVPGTASASDILALNPDGVVLSNGPGDPAATGEYAIPVIRELVDAGLPMLGICLGHQMLAIALGGKTVKMEIGRAHV